MESGHIRMSLTMSKRRIDKAMDCRNCVCSLGFPFVHHSLCSGSITHYRAEED
jgi:hypothetical protein